MNIFRMLSAILRGLYPYPLESHVQALQNAYAREAAMQTGREGLDNVTVSTAELMRTRCVWKRGVR